MGQSDWHDFIGHFLRYYDSYNIFFLSLIT